MSYVSIYYSTVILYFFYPQLKTLECSPGQSPTPLHLEQSTAHKGGRLVATILAKLHKLICTGYYLERLSFADIMLPY